MPVPFIMPKFDMDQENATVVEWIKNEGDKIELDEPVLTVETDKVAIEVPAPATGTLANILVEKGDIVPVTTVIAYILEEGETTGDLPNLEEHASEIVDPSPFAAKQTETVKAPNTESAGVKAQVPASPVAVRMAQDLGINLEDVPTSGDKVTKSDIQAYLDSKVGSEQPGKISATPAARRISRELGIDLASTPGSGPGGRVQAGDVNLLAESRISQTSVDEKEAVLVPLEGIRKTIAERMRTSFQVAPHIALSVDVDVSQLELVRSRLNQLADKGDDQRISLTALLVKITGWVLMQNPFINSSLINETIHLWKEINIGVATAIDNGLVVPVIHNAVNKPVSQINAELKDLSLRAREGRLTLAEVKGGTFTISNLGMFGIDQFRAIINPPESAILAVGKTVRKPVVINQNDEIDVRPIVSVTLSADHRVIDGVIAANFLQDLVEAIESPEIILY